MKNTKALKYIISLALICFLTGCSGVMYTDRQRTLLISESKLAEMGKANFQQIIEQSKISQDKAQNQRLKNVASKLAQAADKGLTDFGKQELKNNIEWEFVLIDDPNTVNAFYLPGGKIVLYTGILSFMKTDDEMAVVIGHELGHALAQHGNERVSQQIMVSMGGSLLMQALGTGDNALNQDVFSTVYSIGTNIGILLPYSRIHEYEADRIGMLLMLNAGFNAEACISFWEAFAKNNEGKKTPEFFSTHPSDENRVSKMKEFLPQALEITK